MVRGLSFDLLKHKLLFSNSSYYYTSTVICTLAVHLMEKYETTYKLHIILTFYLKIHILHTFIYKANSHQNYVRKAGRERKYGKLAYINHSLGVEM